MKKKPAFIDEFQTITEPRAKRSLERVTEPRTERRGSLCESRSAVSGTTQRAVTFRWVVPLTALRDSQSEPLRSVRGSVTRSKLRFVPSSVIAAVALFLATLPLLGQQTKHAVYVGARVCGSCHDGIGMGNQYSKWLMTKHARAYTSLSKPESLQIAKLSGVPEPPDKALLCLGCHATAAEAEPWERDPTFAIEDGMQCEKCHGPGSEYATAEVMADREAAIKAGLRIPTKEWCAKCHYVKGSHVAVHKLPQLNIDEALKTIAHPLPEKPALSPDSARGFDAARRPPKKRDTQPPRRSKLMQRPARSTSVPLLAAPAIKNRPSAFSGVPGE